MPNDRTPTFAAPIPSAFQPLASSRRTTPAPMAPVVNRVAQRWMLASLIAPALAVLATTGGPWQSLPASLSLLFAVACGWAVVLLLAPWRSMRDLHPDRPAIRQLVENARDITSGEREISLNALIHDRSDEIGDLSRLLHDLSVEIIDNRRHARMLRRQMDHNIRRETDRATAHLQRKVNTDPLTGLGNRRTLEQQLEVLLGPNADKSLYLTVMAIDLDHFKPINDVLGHQTGDQCLVILAELLRSCVRPEDCAIRLGGDEFIVLIPDGTIEQALAMAARLRTLHAQSPWPHREAPRPTLSIGVSG